MAVVEQKTEQDLGPAGRYGLIVEQLKKVVAASPEARRWIPQQQLDYFSRVANAAATGEPIAWVFIEMGCPELFYGMDITPLCPESFAGAMRAVPGYATSHYKYIDLAQEHMVADYECYLQKVMIGAALSGDIPKPAAIIHATQPCDSALGGYPAIAHVLGVPHYCVDVPYWKDDRTKEYVTDELEGLVTFLEGVTGKKMQHAKLKAAAEHASTAHIYMGKIQEMRKAKPCPITSDVPFGVMTQGGTPEFAEYCKKGYGITKALFDQGKSLSPFAEKKRIAWLATGVGFDPQIGNWMAEKWGAISVMAMFSHYHSKPITNYGSVRSILRNVGENIMDLPMGFECRGPSEYLAENSVAMVKDYHADAAFFTGNVGCKNMWAIIKLVKDQISEECGIPTLVTEVDMGDARVVSQESIRATITQFMETMVL